VGFKSAASGYAFGFVIGPGSHSSSGLWQRRFFVRHLICRFPAICAPSIHVHPCCAAQPVRHLEFFYDHVRIEKMLFDGVLEPVNGELVPDLSRPPGLGLEFKHADAQRYAV